MSTNTTPVGPTGDPVLDRFIASHNCAEAMAASFAVRFGLPEAPLRSAACGFAGGFGGMGHTCGAVCGAVMAIGMLRAPDPAQGREAKQPVYQLVQRFLADFEDRFGSIKCADLVGRNLSAPHAMQEARADGIFRTICPPLLLGAHAITCALLDLPAPPAPRPPAS